MALVPEEKVSFSLYALSVSTLTVAKIRKVYNKLDSKAIAKQVRHTEALLSRQKVTTLVLCSVKATIYIGRILSKSNIEAERKDEWAERNM